MIPGKGAWVQLPARISTVYSKLLPVNDLMILNQTSTYLLLQFFVQNIRPGNIRSGIIVGDAV